MGKVLEIEKKQLSEVENGIEIELFPSRELPPCSKLPIKLVLFWQN